MKLLSGYIFFKKDEGIGSNFPVFCFIVNNAIKRLIYIVSFTKNDNSEIVLFFLIKPLNLKPMTPLNPPF